MICREVAVAPGSDLAYDEREWRDSLVVVRAGEIELHGVSGASASFVRGDLLYLQGVPLRALHNAGSEPAVLVVVSR